IAPTMSTTSEPSGDASTSSTSPTASATDPIACAGSVVSRRRCQTTWVTNDVTSASADVAPSSARLCVFSNWPAYDGTIDRYSATDAQTVAAVRLTRKNDVRISAGTRGHWIRHAARSPVASPGRVSASAIAATLTTSPTT